MTRRNRRWLALLLATLALTAGCTGAGGGAADGATGLDAGGDAEFDAETVVAERTPMATGTPAAAEAGDGSSGRGDSKVGDYDAQQFAERQLILTGRVAVEVDDFEAARSNLTRTTESHGGFVSDTRQEVHRLDNETWTTGVVVLRVPRDNFTAVYERAVAEGELLEAERNSQDVTDQLVDLQARLENLRAERDQLRTIFERANETEDVLRVQRRLSDVQGEIERLEARQQALRERVALSTITVRIREPRPDPDRIGPDEWYETPLLAAFLESVNGVVVTLRAIAVATALAIPYVVVFGVPLGAFGYAVRRRRGGRQGRVRAWLSRRRPGESPPDDSDVESEEE